MRKFTILIIIFVILTAISMIAFAACGDDGDDRTEKAEFDYIEVSSVEELKEMKDTEAYRLTTDIDLGGAYWTPIRVSGFDGNGHTIKNFTISTTYSPAAFFYQIAWLENVTFENAEIYAVDTSYAAVAAANAFSMENAYRQDPLVSNVTVKNSSIQVMNIRYMAYVGSISSRVALENCTATNCSIEILTNGSTVYVGGAVGYASANDTYVENVNIETDTYGDIYAGGVSGFSGDIVGCRADLIDINIKSATEIACGGLAGQAATAENCEVNNATINAQTYAHEYDAQDCYVGGLIGNKSGASSTDKVKNSVVNDISITVTNKKGKMKVGGFAGYAAYTFTSCLAHNVEIICDGAQDVGGFVGEMRVGMTYCASNNVNMMNGEDIFGAKSNSNINCYASGNGKNSNDLPEITSTQWESLPDILNADSDSWHYGSDGRWHVVEK